MFGLFGSNKKDQTADNKPKDPNQTTLQTDTTDRTNNNQTTSQTNSNANTTNTTNFTAPTNPNANTNTARINNTNKPNTPPRILNLKQYMPPASTPATRNTTTIFSTNDTTDRNAPKRRLPNLATTNNQEASNRALTNRPSINLQTRRFNQLMSTMQANGTQQRNNNNARNKTKNNATNSAPNNSNRTINTSATNNRRLPTSNLTNKPNNQLNNKTNSKTNQRTPTVPHDKSKLIATVTLFVGSLPAVEKKARTTPQSLADVCTATFAKHVLTGIKPPLNRLQKTILALALLQKLRPTKWKELMAQLKGRGASGKFPRPIPGGPVSLKLSKRKRPPIRHTLAV